MEGGRDEREAQKDGKNYRRRAETGREKQCWIKREKGSGRKITHTHTHTENYRKVGEMKADSQCLERKQTDRWMQACEGTQTHRADRPGDTTVAGGQHIQGPGPGWGVPPHPAPQALRQGWEASHPGPALGRPACSPSWCLPLQDLLPQPRCCPPSPSPSTRESGGGVGGQREGTLLRVPGLAWHHSSCSVLLGVEGLCLSALICISSRLPPTPISVSSDPSFHHQVQSSTPTPTGQVTCPTLPCRLAVLPRGRGSAGLGVRMLSQAELPLTPQIALGWVLNGAWFPLSPHLQLAGPSVSGGQEGPPRSHG